jgi:DNA adenine methylase
MNSPLPYFGGKSRMAQAIINHIPKHKTYAEVFGGAAWILFRKPPAQVEILNDLDRHLMNFYRVTKYHLESLVSEVAALQPGRDIFYMLREELDRPTLTDIQRAAAYYYIQKQAFAARPNKPSYATGPNRSPGFKPATARKILPMVAERLQSVVLENLPWERFINLYDSPETFFFIDPPYIGHNEYRHSLKREDFSFLAKVLGGIEGKLLLTHTDTDEIKTIFKGFNFEPIEVGYSAGNLSGGQKRMPGKEVFISNY